MGVLLDGLHCALEERRHNTVVFAMTRMKPLTMAEKRRHSRDVDECVRCDSCALLSDCTRKDTQARRNHSLISLYYGSTYARHQFTAGVRQRIACVVLGLDAVVQYRPHVNNMNLRAFSRCRGIRVKVPLPYQERSRCFPHGGHPINRHEAPRFAPACRQR